LDWQQRTKFMSEIRISWGIAIFLIIQHERIWKEKKRYGSLMRLLWHSVNLRIENLC